MEGIIKEQEVNLKDEVFRYLVHWRWFVIGVLLSLALAFIYVKKATRIYSVESKILLKEDSKNDLSSKLSAFTEGGGFLGGSDRNIENEIEILKSRTLHEKVVDSLKASVEIWSQGRLGESFIYIDNPFDIIYSLKEEERNKVQNLSFLIENNKLTINVNDESFTNVNYGQPVTTENGILTISKVHIKNKKLHDKYRVVIKPRLKAVEDLQKSFETTLTNKQSSVLQLNLKHPNPDFAADYLNTLVYFYNRQSVADQRFVSESTSRFISNRLDIIAEELGDVEKNVERYKESNRIADVESEVKSYISNLSSLDQEAIRNEAQISIAKDLIGHIARSKSDDLIPNGIFTGEPAAESMINEVNSLILDKQRMSLSSTTENPNYIILDNRIKELKSNILQSLHSHLNSLQIVKNNLKRQEGELQSKLGRVPQQEREFRIIDRQQKVKEALYLFLLQKREETNITLAATESNAKIIDKAIPTEKLVSPKSMIILLVAIVLGVTIPFAILYLKNILDDKVQDRKDLDKFTEIPFLGDIPHAVEPFDINKLNSRSSVLEAVRIIRTNIDFILSMLPKDRAKVIFTTSTIPGEGKTHTCVNLATAVALTGKRVLLMGMDLRNPKLKEHIPMPVRGFTNYLTEGDKPIEDYIVSLNNFIQFDVLPAGNIPPNPVELLLNEKVTQTFEHLRESYDYIFVDTAPVAPVTDTLLISSNADMVVYVVRANKLERRLLDVPRNFFTQNKLPRMAFALNDVNTSKGYGYGYAYGYGVDKPKEKKALWKRILGI